MIAFNQYDKAIVKDAPVIPNSNLINKEEHGNIELHMS